MTMGAVQFDELERLGKEGDVESQKGLGRKWFLGFTENGIEYESNFEKSIYWLLKAADSGDAECQYLAGVCLFSGYGLPLDTARACKYNNMATNQKYCIAVVAAYSLKQILGSAFQVETLSVEETKTALEQVKELSINGDPFAQFRLAACYDFGRLVLKEEDKGFEYYLPAAEQGHILAQANLAYSYRDGQGTERNNKKALYWFTKAGKKGHISAIVNTATFYEEGKGVPVDEKISAEWLLKGAELGSIVCQLKLGKWYSKGIGVAKDEEKAFHWLLKAAEKDTEAMNLVASMHAEGTGTKVDWVKAEEWYRKAGTSTALKKAALMKKRVEDWEIIRLLWLGWMKNKESCDLSHLPKEILKEVIKQWQLTKQPLKN